MSSFSSLLPGESGPSRPNFACIMIKIRIIATAIIIVSSALWRQPGPWHPSRIFPGPEARASPKPPEGTWSSSPPSLLPPNGPLQLADGGFYHSPHFVQGKTEAEKGEPGLSDLLTWNPAVFATTHTTTTCGDHHRRLWLVSYPPSLHQPSRPERMCLALLWALSKRLCTVFLQKQTGNEPGTGRSKRGASHRVVRRTPRRRR